MSRPGTFYGLGADDTLQRNLDDTNPITFNWSIAAASMVARVAFNNIDFVDCVGTMEQLPSGKWQLNYHPQDRPTNPGLITYTFTDNLGNTDYISVEFIGSPAPPEEVDPLSLSKYGPKRVKTKLMEIEQFDPRVLDELEERRNNRANGLPTFCTSAFCAGYTHEEESRNRCSRG